VPRLGFLLRLLRRYPVDLVELETPGALGILGLWTAKLAGIPVVAHYRTDVLAFSDVLIGNSAGRWIIQASVRLFTRLCGRVIVPSGAMKEKIRAIGIPEGRIEKLPRGVDLTRFHPDKRSSGAWERFAGNGDGPRLAYIGRVSREKGL